MKRLCKEALEALTRTYWAASTTLSRRGSGIASKGALGHLIDLSRDRDYERLRCVAAGRLASLGLSDLVRAPQGVPNADPGRFVLGRMSGGEAGCLAVRDDTPSVERRGTRQRSDPEVLPLPRRAALVLKGAP